MFFSIWLVLKTKKNNWKLLKNEAFLRTWLEIDFSWIWGRFWGHFGSQMGAKIVKKNKNVVLTNMTAKKSRKTKKGHASDATNRLSSPKRTIPGLATNPGIRNTPLVPAGTVAD